MPVTEIPFIPDLTRWFGSLQARVERRPLVLGQLARWLVVMTAIDILLTMVGASLDLVMVTNVLERLPEPLAMLADMRPMLRGRFRRTTFITIVHNAIAGIAGMELNQ